MFEALHPAYTGESEASDTEVTPALGEVEVSWTPVLPVPSDLGSWLVFERNGCVAIPGAISTIRCNGLVLTVPLKGSRFMCTNCKFMDSHPLNVDERRCVRVDFSG